MEAKKCAPTESRLHPKVQATDSTDRGYAWIIALATAFAFSFNGVFMFASGLLHINLLEKYGEGHSKTAWAGALFSANFSMAGPVGSILARRFSCRTAMMTSGVLLCAGFLLTGYADSVDQCIVTLGFIAGVGGGINATVGWTILGFYFSRYLTIASGFVGVGIGLGTLIFAPLIQLIMQTYGYTGTFYWLAGIALQNVVVGALYRKSTWESRIQHTQKIDDNFRRKRSLLLCQTIRQFITTCTDIPVMLMSFSLFLNAFGSSIVYYFLPSYCLTQGSSPLQVSWVVSATGIGSMIGRSLLGLAVNSWDSDNLTTYFSCLGLAGICISFFPLYSHIFLGQLILALTLGVYTGGIFTILGPILIQLVGIGHHSYGFGVAFFLYGIGSLIGPIITAILIDGAVSYEIVFVLAGLCNISAALTVMLIPVVQKRNPDGAKTGLVGGHTEEGTTLIVTKDMVLTFPNTEEIQVKC